MSTIFEKSLTQLSKSTDSLGSILLRENPLWNRHIKQYEPPPNNNKFSTVSKALISAVAEKKREIKGPIKRPTMVKTAALLYEITDRTNRLAQPRIRSSLDNKSSQRTEELKINRIFEITTTRLIELAKPRVPFKTNPNTSFSVSPNALKAVATPRILELSKPRNKVNSKLPRKRKINSYGTCSARIEYLAKPRLNQHQKMKLKSSKRQSLSSHSISKNKEKKQRYNVNSRGGKKLQKTLGYQKKKINQILQSNSSSRSVILVSSYDECVKKCKSRKNRNKNRKKRKLTWMRKFIKNNSLSTLSNSNHHVYLKRCDYTIS